MNEELSYPTRNLLFSLHGYLSRFLRHKSSNEWRCALQTSSGEEFSDCRDHAEIVVVGSCATVIDSDDFLKCRHFPNRIPII